MSKHPEKERDYVQHIDDSKIVGVEVEDELKKSFIAYAMAVNVSRAIPDVRDGLKPVHRRILYSMNELGLTSDHAFRKCALIVGDVLGKYHPHGDSSVYDALVRLAQDFSIRCPLVDGHGNFGSVDGDPAAAYRYTEARLSKIASEMIKDLEKNTVDMYPNFDDTRMQPTVMPARYPNLLVNGADGIAVGMATSIPPHNLGEVIDATIALMNNPELTVDDLCDYIPAPDYPTGALVLGRAGIRQAYRTGRGRAIIRAKTEIEELPNGKSKIIVTEIPYQVNKAKLIETIADQVKDKRIEGISDISEESDRTGMRIVIECKRDANPQVVLNTLFKQTSLQISNSMILLALEDGVPKILNLKQILEDYIKHQIEVISRRTKFDLEKAEEREHILHGLAIALANIDEVIETIKKSSDRQDAMNKLVERFLLSEKQANAVLIMQLQRLSSMEVDKINDELLQKQAEIAEYRRVLGNEEAIKEYIITDLTDIKTKYGTPRRSEISYDYTEIDIEDLIDREDIVITMTHFGYIKRIPVSEYKSQRRGGMGVTAHKAKEEDFVENMFVSNTHEELLFFTNFGKVFSLKGYEIPEAQRTARGRAIINLLQLIPEEKVTAVLPIKENPEGFLMLATKNGLIKKTPLSEFASIKRNGKKAITFVDDDELVSAIITSGHDELIMAATNGLSIRFNEEQVRATSRSAQGVKSMKLAKDERVVDMAVLSDGAEILTISQKGYGKRSSFEDYPLQGRAGKGVKAGVFNEKTGDLINLKVIAPDTDVMIITDNGIIIRIQTDEISKIGRATQGVRIMKIKEEANIVSIALTPHEDEEEVQLDENGNPIIIASENEQSDNMSTEAEQNTIKKTAKSIKTEELPLDMEDTKENNNDEDDV
ncbi:MAG TPA: DNA gyrase subunit A [Clostridia bacterium]|nr:DNA gyrase subunit A [Clostridia bacterium]